MQTTNAPKAIQVSARSGPNAIKFMLRVDGIQTSHLGVKIFARIPKGGIDAGVAGVAHCDC
jgi:hypothetical protein